MILNNQSTDYGVVRDCAWNAQYRRAKIALTLLISTLLLAAVCVGSETQTMEEAWDLAGRQMVAEIDSDAKLMNGHFKAIDRYLKQQYREDQEGSILRKADSLSVATIIIGFKKQGASDNYLLGMYGAWARHYGTDTTDKLPLLIERCKQADFQKIYELAERVMASQRQ